MKDTATTKPRAFYQQLHVVVLAAMLLGIGFGYFCPETAVKMKPLGDAFINLVKMLIGPIIFCTVVHGIASMGDLKKLGRVGGKTLLYFEVVSTFALVIGLVVVNVLKPGVGFNIDPATLDPNAARDYAAGAHSLNTVDFLMNLIPKTFLGAFISGDLLQVLVVAALVAFALQGLGERGKPVLHAIETGSLIFFGIMRIVVKLAPIGVFGAMAFTVGSNGVRSLGYLFELIAGFYVTAGLFIVFVLGTIAWGCGFSIFRFLLFIKKELILVLGTSSSETALPGLIEKMKRLGCAESTVGLVIPAGYSFNLDGTNIYMAMATVFLAQATNTPLDLRHQISLLLVAMITSKGASGVTGAGFVALAATLAAVPSVPLSSLALLVGIDRLMSQCRSFTNLIGNGVATVVVSRWENELPAKTLNTNLVARKTKPLISAASVAAVALLMAVGQAGAAPLPVGFGKMEVGEGTNAIPVYTYKPGSYNNGPLLVVFHGMLRNADFYCSNAVPLAERYHLLIAAPCFDTNHFSRDDYNLGGVIKDGVAQPRETWTYQHILETINTVRERENNPTLPYYLIGHSAGGQFAMRYAAMMPPGAVRIVAANPGSDLFPRRDWEFGYGFGGLPPELSDDAALQRYLAAPLTLYLGRADIDPHHPELDRTAPAEREGAYRLARGRACFAYAQKLAKSHGWKFNWRKVEVDGIAHDGKAMMAAKQAGIALFGDGSASP